MHHTRNINLLWKHLFTIYNWTTVIYKILLILFNELYFLFLNTIVIYFHPKYFWTHGFKVLRNKMNNHKLFIPGVHLRYCTACPTSAFIVILIIAILYLPLSICPFQKIQISTTNIHCAWSLSLSLLSFGKYTGIK
jgi:hypothetical protein